MLLDRRGLMTGAAVLGASPLFGRPSRAQGAALKIGVLNDQSGVYRDISGPTSVACVRQAVQDFGQGLNVEVLVGDHQNRPALGATSARQWLDRDGVDVIVDVPNSAVALAVNGVVRE